MHLPASGTLRRDRFTVTVTQEERIRELPESGAQEGAR
jgi:hypothetical protein